MAVPEQDVCVPVVMAALTLGVMADNETLLEEITNGEVPPVPVVEYPEAFIAVHNKEPVLILYCSIFLTLLLLFGIMAFQEPADES